MSHLFDFLRRTKGRKKLALTDIISYLYLGMGVILMFGPIIWLVLSSFKTSAEIVKIPAALVALPPGNRGCGGL